jgi:NlpC/P60 family putative phage cell wall peptidase
MATRAELVAEALSWVGTPFVHQGAAKGVGCDCVGLIKGVAQSCGLYRDAQLPPYLRVPDPKQMHQIMLAYLDPIPYAERALADILHFRFGDFEATHIGMIVCLDPYFMVHAWSRQGVNEVRQTRVDRFWNIAGCYRLRGLED